MAICPIRTGHRRTNETRGFRKCPFRDAWRVHVTDSVPLLLGHAEYHIPGPDGTTYAAPTTVIHYVHAHGYQPPAEFIDAALMAEKALDEQFGP
jgi:hypothetical protein